MSQYSDPAPKGYVVNPGRTAMDYGQAIQFVFQNPNWIVNLVFPALCYIPFICLGAIPFIGQLFQQVGIAIAVGYGWEGSASLLATNGTRYADFDFNRITVYVARALGWLIFAVISFALSSGIQLGLRGVGAATSKQAH